MSETHSALYARLGGYDAIAAVVDSLRGRQLTVDFIAAAAGGPTFIWGAT
jgi:hypothetical protein